MNYNQPNYIFLDIDGVLNNHKPLENNTCGINKENIAALNLIMDECDPFIILSSAWRSLIAREDLSLRGFEIMLQTHGLKCFNKLVSHTRFQMFQDNREEEILEYIIDNRIHNYVILDDLPLDFTNLNIPAYRFIKTDPHLGLTIEDAQKAISTLKEPPNEAI